MVTEESRESDVLSLIAHLRSQERESEEALARIRRNIEAAELVLSLLRERRGIPVAERTTTDSLIERVRVMTHQDALVAIANVNNGVVRVKDAKRIFLQAGLKKNPKTASPGITSVLSRSNRFEHTGPGEYTLVSPNQRSPLRAS